MCAGPDDPTLDLPSAGPPRPKGAVLVGDGTLTAVGPYRVLSLLGEGGFGSVFLAEQTEPVRRRVALKVIKPGMDSRAVVARFEAERQALALMDHPGLAKVYDAGMTGGGGERLYFAMELVQGAPITAFCERHTLDVDGRVRLMIQVCEAVQHAHMKGVIHRDLKPSNVLAEMVDGRPVAKVIDFGVAKALGQRLTDSTVHTEHGQMIGTPEYMAPEQARGSLDVDTRADVYALGAILYELLTGVTPFDSRELRAAGFLGVAKHLEEVSPARPSERVSTVLRRGEQPTTVTSLDSAVLSRRLRGDLDWIVMKCLEKDRARRYDSASALAADLERYLRTEPVLAGSPSAGYRVAKFVRRHRTAVIGAAAAGAALLLAVVGTSAGLAWALRERERAQQHAAAAEAAREESDAVVTFLSDMLESASPEEAGRDVTVREIVDRSAGALGERFGKSPLVEARLRQTIGNTYRGLGMPAQAEPQLVAAVELRRRELGPKHPRTLLAMANLSGAWYEAGKLDEAEQLGRETLEGMRETFGRDHEATLGVLNNLAQMLSRRGRVVQAETLQAEVVESYRRTLGADHPHALGSMVNHGLLLSNIGRRAEALEVLRTAASGWRRAHGESHPGTLLAMENLGSQLNLAGQGEEAERISREVVAAKERVLGERHPGTIRSRGNLGLIVAGLGRLEEGEALVLRAWEESTEVLGAEHPDTIGLAMHLLTVYEARGWPERTHGRMAGLADTLKRVADRPRASAETLNSAAWLLLTIEPEPLRDPATALTLAERACERERATGETDLWQYLDTLALAQHRTGRPAAAVRSQQEAISRLPSHGEQYRAEMEERLREFQSAADAAGTAPND